jgi:hypothetical protein
VILIILAKSALVGRIGNLILERIFGFLLEYKKDCSAGFAPKRIERGIFHGSEAEIRADKFQDRQIILGVGQDF